MTLVFVAIPTRIFQINYEFAENLGMFNLVLLSLMVLLFPLCSVFGCPLSGDIPKYNTYVSNIAL